MQSIRHNCYTICKHPSYKFNDGKSNIEKKCYSYIFSTMYMVMSMSVWVMIIIHVIINRDKRLYINIYYIAILHYYKL